MKELKPFETVRSVASGYTGPARPSKEDALEVFPIMIFSPGRTGDTVRDMRPQIVADVSPVDEILSTLPAEVEQSEEVDDADPKDVTSSAIDSVNASGSDSSEIAAEIPPTHPSSLSDEKVTPAPAEKGSSQQEASSSLQTSPGLPEPPAWELEPLPTVVISSSPEEGKQAN